MPSGIVIHITFGKEKRTELFSKERIRIGSLEGVDLQIRHSETAEGKVWFVLEDSGGIYRIVDFDETLGLSVNGAPIRRFIALSDGDEIAVAGTEIKFSFFLFDGGSSLVTTNRPQRQVAQFIEEAAMESAASAKRDDAKMFLREFVRELSREISLTTKLITLVLIAAFITGILYIGYAVSRELNESRRQSEQQSEIIRKLEEKLSETNEQIGQLDKTNKDLMKTVSLAPNLRVAYGGGVCLIVGVYDLVDKRNGKQLRYADPTSIRGEIYEAVPSENPAAPSAPPVFGLTTEGAGSPVEYDFIGTGFHVGSGFIVTNRHVVRPWEEDDQVKQMMAMANGRPRVKKLVIYFPNFAQPFPLSIRQLSQREDIAIGTIDATALPPEVPTLPIDMDVDSVAVGKTVVSMGYPNGPDRLLAMVDDDEAKSINQRFGNSRTNLINFLAQSQKIVPLTTQGLITDLDSRRIVHDAKTAEGGSGAPLFGQSGKVIGVNFGVFTESTAVNMAVPIRFAVDLLRAAGWRSPDELQEDAQTPNAARPGAAPPPAAGAS